VPVSTVSARLRVVSVGCATACALAASALAAGAFAAYSRISGLELYYDGALAMGRESAAVKGRLEPDAALQALLIGTGLVSHRSGPRSVTIAATRPVRVADPAMQLYFAAVQAQVSEALCSHAATRPTSGDWIIQFWVSPRGEVEKIRLLDGPRATVGESAFALALRGLQIKAIQPAGLPQPITMAILARKADQPSGCADSTMTAAR